MTAKRDWFQKPLAAICMLAGITVLSGYIIFNSDGRRTGGEDIVYSITMRHYGIDANQMERDVSIPLEDALSAIPGIDRITTLSENGQVRVYAGFRADRRGFFSREDLYYDSVREAAQKVYETLPPSAQRPELHSSGNIHIPFWTAAVYNSSMAGSLLLPDGALLERVVKPALGGIEGIGEVEIAGSGIKEIIIVLDEEKTSALGLDPGKIAASLASNDAVFPGGTIVFQGREIPLRIDGRYPDLRDLEEVLIPLESSNSMPLGTARLKDIADISMREKEAETISRLNGKKTVIISVTAASGTDPGSLSGKIKKEIENFSPLPLEFRILEDRGTEESRAFRSVLIAALEASFLVALAAVLLGCLKPAGSCAKTNLRNALICAGAIPLISIISAAFLSAMGFPLNRKFLAGLAVGIGGAADAVILGAEGFSRAGNAAEGKLVFRKLWPPLVSGAATNVAALLPLAEITAAEDITVMLYALGTVTLVSLILALTLLPPVFLLGINPGNKENCLSTRKRSNGMHSPPAFLKPVLPGLPYLYAYVSSMMEKSRKCLSGIFSALVRFCMKRSIVFPLAALVIFAAALAAMAAAGADTAGDWAPDSVYVQIEFEGGFLKEEGDLYLASWAAEMKKHPVIVDVQTGARTGSGYGLVTFDSGKSEVTEIMELIRSIPIPNAFIYIPEQSPGDRIWNITVSGDDGEKCRELAREAAYLCSAGSELRESVSGRNMFSLVKETVLNFKQGSRRLTLVPRRELLARGGMFFSLPADSVRRGVYGPVAYKRNENGGDIDVRIKFSSAGMLKESDVYNISVASAGGNQEKMRIGSLMEARKTQEVTGIRRENRRRIASFSIRTDPGDPRFFRDIVMEALKDLELPPGYKIEFDPEAIRQAESLSGKFLNFIWAVLFCYMIIAAAEESFILPLVILSSIPPSLAVPVLILIFSGIPVNSTVACALVAVSGITVNASVISAGELWKGGMENDGSVRKVLNDRLPALLATTGTTIAGVIPFLFLKEGNNAMVRILSLVTVLGVGTSLLCSLTLVPSLMNLYFRFRYKKRQ